MSTRYGGVWPAMVTPLTDDGRPSFPALEQLTDLFAGQNLGGIYLTGSTGQWLSLTTDERKAITDCVVKAAGGRLPVMAHVGAATTADAVELARHAARAGAAAVSAVGPIYFGHPADAVFEHYRRIGAATELPLFVYHLSGVSQVSLDPRRYAERVLALPNIGGMKITDHDLYPFGLIRGVAGDRLHLFSGADELMCHAVLSGAIGAIGTFYNLWGPECAAARAAVALGAVDVGTRFMLRFQAAIAEALAGGAWTFLRAAMRSRYGIDIGLPRPPLGLADKPWGDADVERVRALVEDT